MAFGSELVMHLVCGQLVFWVVFWDVFWMCFGGPFWAVRERRGVEPKPASRTSFSEVAR